MSRNFAILIIILFIGFFIVGCSNLVRPTPTVIPTITSVSTDSNTCQGTLQASTPVVVRPTGIGGTDDSEYGRLATNPKAASTSVGILVTWETNTKGYMRLLNDNAQPIGDINLPLERGVVQTPSLVSKDDGALFTFCGKYDNGKRITSVLLDAHGKFISEQPRFPADQSQCADPDADAIWTGSRLLFAWSSRSYEANGLDTDVILEIADENGNSVLEKRLRTDGMLDPYFAFGHGHVLMVVPTRTDFDFTTSNNRGKTHLAVHRFNVEGTEIGEPLILDAQSGLELEFGASFLVPTKDGWLILASTFLGTSHYYVTKLAADGSLVSGPTLVDTDSDIVFLDAVAYGGGAMVLANHIGTGFDFSKILFISAEGTIKQEWHPGPNEYMAPGELVLHKGRLFVTYATASHGKPVTNEILIRELQCNP